MTPGGNPPQRNAKPQNKGGKKGQKHVPKHQNDLKKTREKTAT